MEEGKIATVWAQFDATERSPSMYIRMRATLSNTLLAWGRLVNLPFVNSQLVLQQLNVRGMEEGKIATVWAHGKRLKEVNQCI
jgi:predicted ester cyclase